MPTDPNYQFLGELEIGNPDLLPYESMNLDLAYEYYFPSGAMLSAGAVLQVDRQSDLQFVDEQE